MKTLLVKATLKSARRVRDNSVNLTFSTMEEISTKDFTLMDEYFQQNGWLAFQMNEFDGTEIPKENALVEGEYTPSQALRRSLFAKHMAMGGNKDDFPAYYQKAMAGFKRAVDSSFPEV